MPLHSTPTGHLWDRIEIHKPTPVTDGQGGQTRTYAKVATVPGRIREDTGLTFSESQGRMISWQEADAWVDCRSVPSLAPRAGDRLKDTATPTRTFEVLSTVRMEMLFACELKEIIV